MIEQAKKSAYQAPRLVEHGSVRNLTGGSLNNGEDGIFGMTMN
jgi:hypothetical protein